MGPMKIQRRERIAFIPLFFYYTHKSSDWPFAFDVRENLVLIDDRETQTKENSNAGLPADAALQGMAN